MSTPSVISAVQKLRSLLTPKEKREWLSFVGIALISSALEIVTASVIVVFAQVINQPELGMKYIVKAGLEGYVRSDQVVLYLAILFGLIYLVKNMISAFEAFFQNFSIQRMNYNFKKEMLKRYTYMDYSLYLTRNSSFGMTVVGGDIEKVYSTGMPALAAVISEGVVFVCLVGMIVFMDPSLFGFIFGIGGFVGFCIYKWFLPMFYNWGKHLQETALLSTKNLLQFFHAFKEILLLGKQDTFIEVYHRISQKRSRIQAVQTATNTLPRVVIEVLFVGLFVLTISYMSVNYDQPQQMLGMLGGYLYVGFRVMPGLNRIIGQLNNFKTVIPSVERMDQEYSTAFSKENYVNVPGLKFEKNIVIRNAFIKYRSADTDALKNVTLTLQKGESIGIIGETGSGKSTFIDMLLGLLRPYKGDILIDGKYPVNSPQWHKMIGYVPQSIYLTDDTIEANIAFGVEAEQIDIERLETAISGAQLSTFILKLPDGVKTIVGEHGVRLSGGERQRVSIARALYHNPEVLIFDEATSALDNATEKKLMDTIGKLSKVCTVVMVAHRLSTLRDCQRIIHIKDGIVEEGELQHEKKA